MTLTVRWWYFGILAGALVASYIAGRGSVPRGGTIAITPPSTARDGGVPEAVATATIGPATTTTVLTCKAEPPKVIRYPVPGTGYVSCPQVECPTLECTGTSDIHTSEAHADAHAPVVPPTIVTVHDIEPTRKWGIGPAGLWVPGKFSPGATVAWQPIPWLEVNVSATTNPAVTAGLLVRF